MFNIASLKSATNSKLNSCPHQRLNDTLVIFTETSNQSYMLHDWVDVKVDGWHICQARCSSMVRVFAHGVMGHWIDPSW